jgi:hypothetical protein
MPETSAEQRCRDAIGVLPLETVLAQEHDRVHGASFADAMQTASVDFDAAQFTAPGPLIDRLAHAWVVWRSCRSS